MKKKKIKAWGGYCPKLGTEGVKYSTDLSGENALYAVFRSRKQARKFYECVRPVWILDNPPPNKDSVSKQ